MKWFDIILLLMKIRSDRQGKCEIDGQNLWSNYSFAFRNVSPKNSSEQCRLLSFKVFRGNLCNVASVTFPFIHSFVSVFPAKIEFALRSSKRLFRHGGKWSQRPIQNAGKVWRDGHVSGHGPVPTGRRSSGGKESIDIVRM